MTAEPATLRYRDTEAEDLAAPPLEASPLLGVEGLTVRAETPIPHTLLRGVSLDIGRGRSLGLVGESGSGKSLTCLAMLGLLAPNLRRMSGRVWFDGTDLAGGSDADLMAVRGRRIAMIFQDPTASLNPIRSIGRFLTDLLARHRGLGGGSARAEAVRLLDTVGIPSPRDRLRCYPHELSGGQNQRVMIAGALAVRPDLLIADEPTTALDVTSQAQILDLLAELRRETGMALLIVTHDFGVISEAAERVAVMYAGRIVEEAPVADLFRHPRHPYTAGLLGSIPPSEGRAALRPIAGHVPSLMTLPGGCAFAPRCRHRAAVCEAVDPEPAPDPAAPDTRAVACHLIAGASTMR